MSTSTVTSGHPLRQDASEGTWSTEKHICSKCDYENTYTTLTKTNGDKIQYQGWHTCISDEEYTRRTLYKILERLDKIEQHLGITKEK